MRRVHMTIPINSGPCSGSSSGTGNSWTERGSPGPGATTTSGGLPSRDRDVLRCPGCGGELHPGDESPMTNREGSLRCNRCDETFPVIDGIPRMLLTPLRRAVMESGPCGGADPRQVATARSFGFEWSRFPEMRDEWERNFLEYMAPHGPEFFPG